MTVRSTCVIAVALGALATGGAFAEEPERPPRPTTLEELGRLLDGQPGRLEELLALANRDPKYRDIERYRSLKPEEYDAPKRQPRTKDVLDLVFDTEKDPALRQTAFAALTTQTARASDPDFREDRRRNRFSLVHVVDHLSDDDARSRGFAEDWLKKMHGNATDAAILNYDRRDQGKPTWKPAANAWKRILRR